MIRLMVVCLATTATLALSNPDIATKSTRSTSLTQNQHQSTQKATSQQDEAMLNSINTYAQQYDTSQQPQQQQQQYSEPFIPSNSIKLSSSGQYPTSPTLEMNFQPMPSPQHRQPIIQQTQQSPPTPVIMQYLPQTQLNDGVQYLQLIPTRPLIVPISPYVSPMSQPYHTPNVIPQAQTLNAARSLLSADPDLASSFSYGLPSYANALQNYRTYRINREINPNNIPAEMTLNSNEYMPSPNDAPKSTMMIRGRP